jgi:hypothetical protein
MTTTVGRIREDNVLPNGVKYMLVSHNTRMGAAAGAGAGGRVPRGQRLHRRMSDEFSVEDVARYWDGNAEAWAEQVRRGADVAREWLNNPAFLEFIGDLRGRRVLDAGCGEGYNTRILARRGARMTDVDLSERMIAPARAEEPASRSASSTRPPRTPIWACSPTRASTWSSRSWR